MDSSRPLNNILNRINDWALPINPNTGAKQGVVKQELLTRSANFGMTLPTEVTLIAGNILLVPVQIGGAILKAGVKTIEGGMRTFRCVLAAESLKNFGENLPGLSDCLKTVARIVRYVLGALSTATLGVVFSPKYNYNVHYQLGLVKNQLTEAATTKGISQEKEKQAGREAKEVKDAEELAELNNLATAHEILNSAEAEKEARIKKEAEEKEIELERNLEYAIDSLFIEEESSVEKKPMEKEVQEKETIEISESPLEEESKVENENPKNLENEQGKKGWMNYFTSFFRAEAT